LKEGKEPRNGFFRDRGGASGGQSRKGKEDRGLEVEGHILTSRNTPNSKKDRSLSSGKTAGKRGKAKKRSITFEAAYRNFDVIKVVSFLGKRPEDERRKKSVRFGIIGRCAMSTKKGRKLDDPEGPSACQGREVASRLNS